MATQAQPKSQPRDSFFINDKKKRKRKPKKPKFRNQEDEDRDQENPQPNNAYPKKKIVNNKKKINRDDYSDDEPEEMNNNGASDDDEMDFDNNDVDSENENEESDEDDELAEELAEMPFDELQQFKKTEGVVDFRQRIKEGLEHRKKQMKQQQKAAEKDPTKKRSKSAPAEISAKVPVSRKRIVVHVEKPFRRDPRFDNLSGHFNADLFKKSYDFLDTLKDQEIVTLRTEIQKEKDPVMAEKLKRGLEILQQRRSQEQRDDLRQKIKRDFKKKEAEKVAQGKTPYYFKESDLKRAELAEKFKDLKSQGKLDKYMQKKRKRDASKDQKMIPFKRRNVDGGDVSTGERRY